VAAKTKSLFFLDLGLRLETGVCFDATAEGVDPLDAQLLVCQFWKIYHTLQGAGSMHEFLNRRILNPKL
jgi:hypothetical protein